MDDEQKKKILSFLSRCQNDEMAQTTSIARYLGLTDARRVLSLLRQMTSEGLIKKTGNRWQLCRDGSPPNAACGCGGVESPALPVHAANHLHGLSRRSSGQRESSRAAHDDDDVTSRLSTLNVEHRRRSEGTGNSVSYGTENGVIRIADGIT